MKTWARFLGMIGLLVLAMGIVCAFVFNLFSAPPFLKTLIIAHLVIGLICLINWVVFYGTKNLAEVTGVVSGRTARLGVNAVIYTLLLVVVLVTANLIAHNHNKRWDLTAEGVYSLAPQSVKVVENLKQPLKLVAFKGNQLVNQEALKDLFALYGQAGGKKLSTEIVDPRSKPHLVDKYEIKPGNLVYLEYGEEASKNVSRINETTEEAITNAILKLTRGAAKKIYIAQGHGEPSVEDSTALGLKEFAEAIKDENLTLEGIFLGEKGSMPDDAAALVLMAPKKNLPQSEKDLVIKYVEGGGHVLLMAEPRVSADLVQIASHFGIEIGKNVVLDIQQRLFAGPALGTQIIARNYGPHALTRNMSAEHITVFDMATTVSQSKDKQTDANAPTYTELVKSGGNAWAEVNLADIFDSEQPTASLDKDDTKGPVTLALAYEKKINDPNSTTSQEDEAKFDKTSRIVVFGSSAWIQNQNFGYYANRDLVLNAVNWLVGEEGGITIRARSLKTSIAPISKDTFIRIFAASILVPELILILGLFVWWKRKTTENI